MIHPYIVGSLSETETLVMLAVKVGLLEETQAKTAQQLAAEIGRMLNSLLARLQQEPLGSDGPDEP